jgi:phosphomannomutase
MLETNALIGGEESGGYGFQNHIPERDGILSSLYFLSLMNAKQMYPSQLVDYLESIVGPHYYGRRDIKIHSNAVSKVKEWINPQKPIANLGSLHVISSDFIDGRRLRFQSGWVTVRLSGTEPLIRIYAESPDTDNIDSILNKTVASLNI